MSGYYNRNNRGITKKLGPVTAYADAVLAGYKGTREQWAQDMAKLGQNVTQVAQNTKLTTELAERTRENTEQVAKDTADVRRLADETGDNAAQVASNTAESNRLAEETKQAAAQAKADAEYAGAAADNFRVDTTLSEEGKAAEAKTTGEKFAQLSEELDKHPVVEKDTDLIDNALEFADESGNVAFCVKKNAHIKTKVFDSENTINLRPDTTLVDTALEFSDENGNVVLRITNAGHVKTKAFDSENISATTEDDTFEDELNLSRCDFGKEMTTGIDYYVEGDVIVCKCAVSTLKDSVLKIFTAVGSGVARGSASFVNFETGEMGMYGGISATSSALTVRYSKTIGFGLVAGREYVIEMMKKGKEHTLKITDAYSLESDTLVVMPTGSSDLGEHWGKRSYTVSGGVTVDSFKDYSLQPYECRLLIIGDSFIEGATGFSNHANRYCARMKRLLNGSCAINGFGGASTEQVSAFYEAYCKTLFKPEYVLIACGTNNSNYSSWLTAQKALIASIKAAGSIPVLVTITRRLDYDNLAFIRQANAWIRNESGELYIDINRITTINYDGETQNTAMFATDKVHPLPSTHEIIVKKALLDIPEVFNLSASYVKNRNNAGGKN